MGIQVIDKQKRLSKNQVQKVKTAVKEFLSKGEDGLDYFLNEALLPKIVFMDKDSNTEEYNTIQYEKDDVTGHVKIIFAHVDKTLRERVLKGKLKTLLNERNSLRKVSGDENTKLWKTYARMRKYTPANIPVPNPSEIKKEVRVFAEMVDKMPSSPFKQYVQDCINL